MSAKDFSLAMGEISDKYISEAINYTAASRTKRAAAWHFPLSKRAVAIIAAIVVLFTTACSVEAIREPIVKFFVEVYETFIEYTFEGDNPEEITKEYCLSAVPDGFSQTDYINDGARITTEFDNANGNKIRLSQTVADDTNLFIDNEQTNQEMIDVAGRKVHLYLYEESAVALWVEDVYLLKIVYHGNISRESMIALIEAVQ